MEPTTADERVLWLVNRVKLLTDEARIERDRREEADRAAQRARDRAEDAKALIKELTEKVSLETARAKAALKDNDELRQTVQELETKLQRARQHSRTLEQRLERATGDTHSLEVALQHERGAGEERVRDVERAMEHLQETLQSEIMVLRADIDAAASRESGVRGEILQLERHLAATRAEADRAVAETAEAREREVAAVRRADEMQAQAEDRLEEARRVLVAAEERTKTVDAMESRVRSFVGQLNIGTECMSRDFDVKTWCFLAGGRVRDLTGEYGGGGCTASKCRPGPSTAHP